MTSPKITTDDLAQLVGYKEIELHALRKRAAQLEARVLELEKPIDLKPHTDGIRGHPGESG